VDTDIVNGKTLLGFRVPVVIASPFSRGVENNPFVNHLVFDHTSILKLIEWRWGLAPLTPRDASSDINNLAYALNFAQPVVSLPTLPVPHVPFFPEPCLQTLFSGLFSRESVATTTSSTDPTDTKKWRDLQARASVQGFR
jgi:phospholipase C